MNENHQLIPQDESLVTFLADARSSNAELQQCVTQLAQLIVAFKAQMDAVQRDLQTKVTVSAAQAKAIQEAVRGRAIGLCNAKGLSYARCGRTLREAIWREFCAEFAVSSRYDLPAHRFQSAISFIEDWNSLSVIRKLRDKYGG